MRTIFAILAMVLPGIAAADYVRVLENLANPNFPTHTVYVSPQSGGRGANGVVVRCENNRTEVFVPTEGVFGYQGIVRVKWADMPAAARWSANDSTTGTAAFLSQPIAFVLRLVQEGSVVVEVEGYNVRGAARFDLSPETRQGIYDLATTCQWVGQLPTPVAAPAPDASATGSDAPEERIGTRQERGGPFTEDGVRLRLRGLLPAVEQFGRDAIIEMLDQEIAAN